MRVVENYIKDGHDYIPLVYYQDSLEFQNWTTKRSRFSDVLVSRRYGLYSKGIRNRAWDIILLLMERRRTEHLTDIVATWLSTEIQLMIRQLSVFKLSDW